MDELLCSKLEQRAATLRRHVVEMIGVGNAGHLGGSCSLAELVAALYFQVMHHDPANPKLPQRDRFILSKGHAALIQYAALGACGYFDTSLFPTLKTLGSPLQGHPDIRKLPGLEANTGSLGQGVSIGCGIAAALKLNHNPARVFTIVGDGELAEGQLWEAFMSAANFRLDNLRVILDMNGLQATGKTADRFHIGQIAQKFEAFGFAVREIDGHSFPEILEAMAYADTIEGKPVAILAKTVKGKGIPFAENVAGFHNNSLTQEQYDAALAHLKREEGKTA